jgi:predicted mannosyl-3-phosphoglycerate phosphatase (HAD superfamily)
MIDSTVIAQKILGIIGQMHELRKPRTIPSENALRRVIEDVFWSSLDRYEGNPIRARVFFAPRQALQESGGIIRLEERHLISLETIRRMKNLPFGAIRYAIDALQKLNSSLSSE